MLRSLGWPKGRPEDKDELRMTHEPDDDPDQPTGWLITTSIAVQDDTLTETFSYVIPPHVGASMTSNTPSDSAWQLPSNRSTHVTSRISPPAQAGPSTGPGTVCGMRRETRTSDVGDTTGDADSTASESGSFGRITAPTTDPFGILSASTHKGKERAREPDVAHWVDERDVLESPSARSSIQAIEAALAFDFDSSDDEDSVRARAANATQIPEQRYTSFSQGTRPRTTAGSGLDTAAVSTNSTTKGIDKGKARERVATAPANQIDSLSDRMGDTRTGTSAKVSDGNERATPRPPDWSMITPPRNTSTTGWNTITVRETLRAGSNTMTNRRIPLTSLKPAGTGTARTVYRIDDLLSTAELNDVRRWTGRRANAWQRNATTVYNELLAQVMDRRGTLQPIEDGEISGSVTLNDTLSRPGTLEAGAASPPPGTEMKLRITVPPDGRRIMKAADHTRMELDKHFSAVSATLHKAITISAAWFSNPASEPSGRVSRRGRWQKQPEPPIVWIYQR